jgi:hypothetical protein
MTLASSGEISLISKERGLAIAQQASQLMTICVNN